MTRGERRRDRQAARIADALEVFGVDAIPADCSEGIVCVVIVHHGEPDADARIEAALAGVVVVVRGYEVEVPTAGQAAAEPWGGLKAAEPTREQGR